ncbi:urease accessory protein UreD [Laspinema olomoucense]|uniref:urease accessory protein UreD n=1 Tax=Laspinema olomoucense TaxID=3231600 RepID=UPI0021BB50CD|nr:urease accessory protein UreD [Laspinema sp. D3a]MCT7988928.1 urease accessory protein UreD [Laspinema sp. D3a]
MKNSLTENPGLKGWHGSLELAYAQSGTATQMVSAKATAPLKMQRPFYPEGEGVCHSVILHTAGGIVGGDSLGQSIHLQENAHALITTAAAAKIYRSMGEVARQTIQIQVDSGAYCEWLPQESIIFNGAIYRQDLRIELAPDARFLLWEINRFGRSARGETFVEGEWRSQTEIWQQGRPLWIDRQHLQGSESAVASDHALGGFPIVATLAWIADPVTPELVQEARSLWERRSSSSDGEAGVTRLTHGLLCRYRGSSTPEVRNWFSEVWQLLRLRFIGRPSCPPRVWPI